MISTLWLLAEFLLISVIAWQDWKDRQVSLGFVCPLLISLMLRQSYSFHSLTMLLLLAIYRWFRRGSIQIVDLVLFRTGAGCFSLDILPIYCMVTAGVLIIFSKILKDQQLPFVTAWAISFLGLFYSL